MDVLKTLFMGTDITVCNVLVSTVSATLSSPSLIPTYI
jgi:hypothetical protein